MIRSWIACVPAVLAGCQVIWPLPDRDEAIGDDELGSGAAAAYASCPDPTCASYCGAMNAECAASVQYPSADACCAACESLGPAAVACRAPPAQDDPVACSAAGPLGTPGSDPSCVAGCGAICDLFTTYCAEHVEGLEYCVQLCQDEIELGIFDACKDAPEHSSRCVVQRLLEAGRSEGEEREKACHEAIGGKCPDHPCGKGGDEG